MKYKPIIMFISLRFEGGQHEIQTNNYVYLPQI
jgi:hypothetical protein